MRNRVVLQESDPYIEHALRECSAYVCDIISHLNLRYSPKVCSDVVRMLKVRMSEEPDLWEFYTKNTSPKVVEETKKLLGIEDC